MTDQGNNTIVRLDPRTGQTTSFPVPTPDATPLGLTLGSDGALWFTERSADQIGRMTLDGAFREWSLDSGLLPQPDRHGARMAPSGSPSSSGASSAACR